MSVAEIILGVVLILFSVAITIVVLLQEGHEQNVGVVTGGADTFLSKNKARSAGLRSSRSVSFCWLSLLMLICFLEPEHRILFRPACQKRGVSHIYLQISL